MVNIISMYKNCWISTIEVNALSEWFILRLKWMLYESQFVIMFKHYNLNIMNELDCESIKTYQADIVCWTMIFLHCYMVYVIDNKYPLFFHNKHCFNYIPIYLSVFDIFVSFFDKMFIPLVRYKSYYCRSKEPKLYSFSGLNACRCFCW